MNMDYILDLPIYENVLDEFIDKNSYRQSLFDLRMLEEMCFTDELQRYYDDVYLSEAVTDPVSSAKKGIGTTLKRTAKTTGGLVKAYDNITTAKGNLYHYSFQMITKLVGLVVRAISFVLNGIAFIPKTLLKITEKLSTIPGDIKAKINGDIRLYITAGDIATMYNSSVIFNIREFIAIAKDLSKGEMWGASGKMKAISTLTGGKIKAEGNDIKHMKDLAVKYAKIKMVKFEPTQISMKDSTAIETYFGNSQVVTYKALDKKTHNDSYYDALKHLLEDVGSQKESLEEIMKAIDNKDNAAHNNGSWAQLNETQRSAITESINMVAKTTTIVANIMKYITADISTIDKAANKILSAANKSKK